MCFLACVLSVNSINENEWINVYTFFAGYFMWLDSLIGQTGDKVSLLSPTMTFSEHSLLTFQYHMLLNDTDTTGALSVFRMTELLSFDTLLYREHGNHGDSWNTAEVCLPSGTYHLTFVGTVGLKTLSDIAIDNIFISEHDKCVEPDSVPRSLYIVLNTFCSWSSGLNWFIKRHEVVSSEAPFSYQKWPKPSPVLNAHIYGGMARLSGPERPG